MMLIKTQRLLIRPPCETDFADLYKLQSDPQVMQYIGRGIRDQEAVAKGLAQALTHQQKYGFSLGSVFDQASGYFIGRAGLIHLGYDDNAKEIEVAYALCPAYWKMGYATEIAMALIEWGFQHLPLDALVAITHPDNQQSQHVLEKAGLRKIKEVEIYNVQHCYYEIQRSYWELNRNRS